MNSDRDLARIARLYYVDGVPQATIADRLGTSVATVSRALKRARESGIVKFSVSANRETGFHEMESRIETRFGLAECRIADPSLAEDESLASEVACVAQRLIGANTVVGVSWGTTLKGLSEQLTGIAGRLAPDPADRRPQAAETSGPGSPAGERAVVGPTVVPLIGAMGVEDTGIFPNTIARNFAVALGGTNRLVNVPAIVDSQGIRDALLSDSSFKSVLELWKRLDLAVFSMSSLGKDSSMVKTGLFSPDQLESIQNDGGVCALNFNFLDRHGAEVSGELANRIVRADARTIASVRHRLAVAHGERKIPAILSAIAGGLVTILVTNEPTARALLTA